MRTLYLIEQGTTVLLRGENLYVKDEAIPLPYLECILVFGIVQITTQVVRACLERGIPIAYLSRSGFCYGRTLPLGWYDWRVSAHQQAVSEEVLLNIARQMVAAKIANGRVLLQRQQRKRNVPDLALAIDSLGHFVGQTRFATSNAQLMGLEGAGASVYFSAWEHLLTNPDFIFIARSRRPPTNPVNAMLSFGYQVLWNHLLFAIELQQLNPFYGCLHSSHHGHAALASDLLEEFRAPIIDSLVIWLVNNRVMQPANHFEYRDGGCYLNQAGKKKFLQHFVSRMEGRLKLDEQDQPRWALIHRQVKLYREALQTGVYHPYRID
ncbi:MAG: CRISPR-associated endonuclease Cas1 [Pseudanabaenaceae cyanobacterium SKYGB_i_bin29]|nr:CRISPR-associated endonuclease Cas1 [Pseudanabaenaceae cyanobacterium SKYG29]MDW8420443.1 CRISPR-associated endonuclease Cas1 [Pseudanabaenaceae cyanobacterium SKYGB_i_bin29]